MQHAMKVHEPESPIVYFDFHGDRLEVVPTPDGEHWVVLARLCEPLGLQVHPQIAKLRTLDWACTRIIRAHDVGKREQDVVCLSIRSVAGWLFTVNVGKVAPRLRKKLATYQRECADVLADHFLGPRGRQDAMVPATQFAIVLDEIRAIRAENQDIRADNQMIRAEGQALRAANDAMAGQLLQLSAQILQNNGTVTGMQCDWIRLQVVELAHMRCALAKNPTIKSARMSIENRIRSAAQWGGCGQKRRDMPADRYPLVKACLAAHRADLEGELKQRKAARKRVDATVRAEQQQLFAKKDDTN